jgi:hypothetical protein
VSHTASLGCARSSNPELQVGQLLNAWTRGDKMIPNNKANDRIKSGVDNIEGLILLNEVIAEFAYLVICASIHSSINTNCDKELLDEGGEGA